MVINVSSTIVALLQKRKSLRESFYPPLSSFVEELPWRSGDCRDLTSDMLRATLTFASLRDCHINWELIHKMGIAMPSFYILKGCCKDPYILLLIFFLPPLHSDCQESNWCVSQVSNSFSSPTPGVPLGTDHVISSNSPLVRSSHCQSLGTGGIIVGFWWQL